MYTTIATWFVKSDMKGAKTALLQLAEAVKAEPGTLAYLVHEVGPTSLPPPAPGSIVFVEIYTDEAAFMAHLNGAAFKQFMLHHQDLFVMDSSGNPYLVISNLQRVAGFVRPELAGP